jgi:lipooligosaccharide transport system permease protein
MNPGRAVLEHNLVAFRRTWRGAVASSFVLPVLFLIAMGQSVGTYVDARSGLGLRYIEYIAPGVLASTAVQVAVFESTFPVFSAFQWSRVYHAALATPARAVDLLTGHLAYVMLRVTIACAGFLLVMTAFGAARSPWTIAALPVSVLLGLASAAPSFAYAATVTSDGMFPVLFRFAVVPMTLFAGVFFPVESMPVFARPLAYVSPLWHGVELCRAATVGTPTAWGIGVHLAYLACWAVGGFLLARRAFVAKLSE